MAPGGVAADVERRVWDPVVEGTILAIVASMSTTSSSETVPSVGDGDRPHRKTPPRWTRSVGESSPRMESGRESGESGARRWAGRRGEGDGDGDGERDGLRRTSDFDGWDAASRGPGPARGDGDGDGSSSSTDSSSNEASSYSSLRSSGARSGGSSGTSPPVATGAGAEADTGWPRRGTATRETVRRWRSPREGGGGGGGEGDTARGSSEASSRRSSSYTSSAISEPSGDDDIVSARGAITRHDAERAVAATVARGVVGRDAPRETRDARGTRETAGQPRVRRGVRRPRGRRVSERVSERRCVNGRTGERTLLFFYRSSPRAPTYAHLDAKVMRVLRYDSPPRHLCRPGIVTRRRPRTRVGRPARRGTRFETTRDSRTPPRTPARSPARISTPPASPPPRRRGRRPSSDSPRPT